MQKAIYYRLVPVILWLLSSITVQAEVSRLRPRSAQADTTAGSLCGPTSGNRVTPTQSNQSNMKTIKTKDGVEIFYKDWGTGQPIVFHHGWPLTSDDWDAQMIFFVSRGYRVIAHDRRGHGRSSHTDQGHDMDTYAADVAALVEALDLKNAIHVGHSTGGGEVIRYVAKYGKGRVAKAVLISAVTPTMAKSDKNPDGIPMSVFDEIRLNTATRRAEYFRDFPTAFFSYNRPDAKPSQAVKDNWWRQGMMGAVKAQYDCIKVFSETDFTEDLKSVDVPVLLLHGEDDQIVPYKLTALKAIKLLRNGKLITYPGFSHGMPVTESEKINTDILSFIKSK